jgi:hypothetical protein
MTWVRQHRPDEHRCPTPMRDAEITVPTGPAAASTGSAVVRVPGLEQVIGRLGDLWRCDDCRKLWRVALACDVCELYGDHRGGQCRVGLKWRAATLRQRFKYRNRIGDAL